MVKKLRSLDDAPLDVFEAVKRAFMKRGFVRQQLATEPPSDTDSKSNGEGSKDQSQSKAKGDSKDSGSSKDSDKSKDPDLDIIDSQPGSQEAAKDPDEPEPGETHEKLIELTEKAQDILFTADTVFPLTIFPDTITLDREKLTVIDRYFFRVAKVITVPISSMISADVSIGPFFGAVHMTSKYFSDNTHVVRYLWRKDAEEIHRLIQGYIIAQEKGVDVSDIDKEDLRVLLNDLGRGTNE